MRTLTRHLSGPRTRDEQGAAAAMLAAVLTVLMGAAAIVIDAGDIWQNRRQLVGAVDAAALAAAATGAEGGDGCVSVAGAYVVANAPAASMSACAISGSSTFGVVTVSAEVEVEHFIAQALGRERTTVTGSASAMWGMPAALNGLRPFALCNESPAFVDWVASGFSTTEIFTVIYSKDSVVDCGGPAPGNWGIIDFDAGANSNADTQDWVEFGYPGEVDLGWYEGDPGAFSNSLPIGAIVGKEIQLPVFDEYNELGGSNAEFRIIGFVSVVIVDFKSNGSEDKRYLDLQFRSGVSAGRCCGSGIDTGLRVVDLCAVDEYGSCDP